MDFQQLFNSVMYPRSRFSRWHGPRAGRIAIRALAVLMALMPFACQQMRAQNQTSPAPTGSQTNQVPSGPRDRITNQDNPVQNQKDTRERPSVQEDRRSILPADLPETPPEPLSEFQEFVLISTGKKVPIFGADLFTGVPATFAPVDQVPVSADYVIGPGDELVLRGWGQIDIDYKVTVDRAGNIFLPEVGNINVSGIRYQQIQPYLKSAIGRVFKGFELSVTMGQLRSIQVFVVGQARRPGSYTVSSLSTLVNAVFASGGPTARGSMRSIQLKRNGALVTDFDLYDLLLRGDKSKDAALLPGDVIYFPPVGPQAAVVGSINLQGIFEIKAHSVLKDLIEAAGGLTPNAAGKSLTLERILGRETRAVDVIEINDQGMATALHDGDLVTVRALPIRFENAVTLRGNVAVPGRYPWKAGLRVSDLIPSREALVTREFWLKQSQMGMADLAGFSEQAEAATEKTADEKGVPAPKTSKPVQPPVRGKADQNADAESLNQQDLEESGREQERTRQVQASLRNEIKRNAPDINWDYAVIQRFNRQDLTTRLLPFNLGKAIDSPADSNNLALEAGDVLTIFSQADIRVPRAKQSKFIRLEGEIEAAGVYEVKEGETLQEIVEKTGGMTHNAYIYGMEFYRESSRLEQQKRIDEFVASFEKDIERVGSSQSQRAISAEEGAGVKQTLESQRKLVDKLRGLKATGRVVLALRANDDSLAALPKLALEDGDRIVIPARPATVNVIGAVYQDSSLLYEPNRSVDYYLRRAGGGTRESDIKRVFVIRANGSVIARPSGSSWYHSSFSDLRLMPGDTVVVPERLTQSSLLKGLKDWSQVMAQFALGAAAFSSLTR